MAVIEAAGQSVEESGERSRSPGYIALRRLLRKRIAVICLVIIFILYGAGIFAGVLAPYGANEQNLDASLKSPSAEHWFGTDRLGRDLFSRVLYSLRTTVIVTVSVLITGGIVLGVSLGMLAGYKGGWVDTVIMRVGDVLFALPGLLIILILSVTLRDRVNELAAEMETWFGIEITETGAQDYMLIAFALAFVGWVGTARIIRSQVLSLRETDFVRAAEAMGAGSGRIIYRHLLPNVSNLIIVGLSAGLGAIAGTEVLLSFLGIGIQPPGASFGFLLQDGVSIRVFPIHPHLLWAPAIPIALLIYSFNLLGDAINDVLDPRTRI
jgi:ABC-type dipeptide/oligopeptide/nickel transport system permease subunit